MDILEYIIEYTQILNDTQIGELVRLTKSLREGVIPQQFSCVAVEAAFLAIKVAYNEDARKESEKEAKRKMGKQSAEKRWGNKNSNPDGCPMGTQNDADGHPMGGEWVPNGYLMGTQWVPIKQEEKESSSPSSPSSLSPEPPISITPISPSSQKEESLKTLFSKKEKERTIEGSEKKIISEEKGIVQKHIKEALNETPQEPSPVAPSLADLETRKREFGMKLKQYTGTGEGQYPRKFVNEFFVAWTTRKEGEKTFPFERVPGDFHIPSWLELYVPRYNKKHNITKQSNGSISTKQVLGAVNLNDGRTREYESSDFLGPEDFPEQ